jgi:hypothetical protein
MLEAIIRARLEELKKMLDEAIDRNYPKRDIEKIQKQIEFNQSLLEGLK